MPIFPVSVPTDPIITLAEAKAHLNVHADDDDDDALISALCLAATQHLDGPTAELGRALREQTWELRLDSFTSNRIRIPIPPLISIESVQYYDPNGALQTLVTSVYQAVGVGGDEPGHLVLRSGQSWPALADQPEAVSIMFNAGYTNAASPEDEDAPSPIPVPILQAAKLLIGTWYDNRDGVVIGAGAVKLPHAVDALLNPYRVVFLA